MLEKEEFSSHVVAVLLSKFQPRSSYIILPTGKFFFYFFICLFSLC